MNETTKNFLQALREYSPPETKPVIWKLIYDPESGKPIDLSAADQVNGVWIEIDRELASKSPQFDPRLRVQDDKIIYINLESNKQQTDIAVPKVLKLCTDGNYTTDTYNMLIVSNQGNNWINDRNS